LNNQVIAIIGTLLGTILGWALNSISRLGWLKQYVGWEDKYESFEESEDGVVCLPEKATYYTYHLTLDIYNCSSIPKIMRNISIQFYKDNKLIYKEVPDDENTEFYSCASYHYKKTKPININPKSVMQVKLRSCIDDKDIFCNFDSIWFVYSNDKNKLKRKLVHSKERKI
jgi:hypothetical protein